jgi:excisionase family DNA binding protein
VLSETLKSRGTDRVSAQALGSLTAGGFFLEKAMQRKSNKLTVPINERLNVSLIEACQLIGIGRTRLYEIINDGELRTIRIGKRRLVPVAEIRDFVARAAK